jgi:glycosyltransferase involved in cell wall biosynthesis
MTHLMLDSQPIVIQILPAHPPSVQRIAVVMATYNGSRFIEEQILSIQMQSHQNWVLYVRDDGSRDDTIQKVLAVAAQDQRVQLVQDGLGNLGAVGCFARLLEVVHAHDENYVFLADQDDVWHPEKLANMLTGMNIIEKAYLATTPLLVHCDLSVVNENLQPVADSFVAYSGLCPDSAHLGVLLCQNQITGCACLINHALLVLACPLPANLRMHDWWLALLAAAAGKVAYIPQPLVQYRQHSGNVVGAVSLLKRFIKLMWQWQYYLNIIRRSLIQAEMVEMRILARGLPLTDAVKTQLHTFSKILDISPLRRVHQLRQQNIGMRFALARFAFNILIILIKK